MKKILTLTSVLFIANICFGQNPDFIYTSTCFGSQTTLVGSSSLMDADVQLWQWDIDGNGTYDYSGKTIVYLFISNDTISVTLKVIPIVGSVDSITKNVIIDPLPNVNFHVDNLCAFKNATYYNQSTIASGSINQFLWDFNNDGITDENSNDTINYICGPAQSYVTRLTCVSDKECSAFATKTTEVFPQPTASFSVSNACIDDSTLFTNTSNISSPDFFLWDFGDDEASADVSPKHKYSVSGNYIVTLIASTTNGCRDTSDIVNVAINPTPDIFITSQNNDTIINNGGEQIMLFGNGAGNYLWWNGSQNQGVQVFNGGVYWVIGTTPNGCQGTDSITIYQGTQEELSLVSNILTPNGDGFNDYLKFNNIETYYCCELEVYNLWNVRVYWEDHCYRNDWGCTLGNGMILPEGPYYYIIKTDQLTFKGNINILTK
ncbi:MAG: hypothetical protein A2X08_14630 [Bacteroidetes bacterium GWA2_32_17]|nr:MAG: hypothetical protein A2X08_14630 [Bacteroidetes bacterium GWA2_32_17]